VRQPETAGGAGSAPAPFLHEPEAWRTLRQVLEDRISHGKRFRIAGEGFQRFNIGASATSWIGVGMERDLLHSPEDLVLRQFGGLFAYHCP